MNAIRPTIDDRSSQSKPLALLALVLAVCLLSGCATTSSNGVRVKNTAKTFDTVVIDAGHGGHDIGARSRYAPPEKQLALDVAKRLEEKLRAAGFKTVMTRRSDEFIPLDGRTRVSNRQRNAIFVSVHFNHAGSKRSRAHGVEVFYRAPQARELASNAYREVLRQTKAANRGVKTANFRVLRKNEYPAILVECGFLSSPTEAKHCASPTYREKLAQGMANAIIYQKYGTLLAPKPVVNPTAQGPTLAATDTTATPADPISRASGRRRN